MDRMPRRARKAAQAFLMALALLAVVPLAAATQTLRGELVELGCYVNHDGKGPDHSLCATSCARMGAPIALKEHGSGRLLIVITDAHFTNPAKLAFGYFGVPVQVKGEVKHKDGITFLILREVTVKPY